MTPPGYFLDHDLAEFRHHYFCSALPRSFNKDIDSTLINALFALPPMLTFARLSAVGEVILSRIMQPKNIARLINCASQVDQLKTLVNWNARSISCKIVSGGFNLRFIRRVAEISHHRECRCEEIINRHIYTRGGLSLIYTWDVITILSSTLDLLLFPFAKLASLASI